MASDGLPKYFESRYQESANGFLGPHLSEKWVALGLLGIIGGSVAYIVYSKKTGVGVIRNPSSQSSRRRQPRRNRSLDDEVKFAGINKLPVEIRTRIWQTLPYEDRLNLRLTSRFTKDDVETYVGLSGRITTADQEKYEFYQKVALSSCRITELQHPISHDFLLNPEVLHTLEIREHAAIPLANIQIILRLVANLKYLKMRLNLNNDTKGISQAVLENLPKMKNLNFLHIKTTVHYVSEMKDYSQFRPHTGFSPPRCIKTIHLEMPDLPSDEVAKWKFVLDKQVRLEILRVNVGNVHWRYFQPVLKRNSGTIERICFEGLRGWDLNRNVEDPLDWNIFKEFSTLKSLDLSCSRGGEHDLMDSVNFDKFPCHTIEEFFISRIVLSIQAVERVYNDMVRLQRGALDQIGNAGIQRANEMAWVVQHADEAEERWWQDERTWDIIAHALFGVSLAFALNYIVRTRLDQYGGGSSGGGSNASDPKP